MISETETKPLTKKELLAADEELALIASTPIRVQRARIGLTTPTNAEKEFLWSKISCPAGGISAETGGYKPLGPFRRLHGHPARFKLDGGGVRSGKSLAIGMEIPCWMPHSNLIWLVAVDYNQSRKEFLYAAQALLSLGFTRPELVSMPQFRYTPCSLETIWGCTLSTISLADTTKFGAEAPDAIFVCEPGQVPEEAVGRFDERASERRGLIWYGGTFEDSLGWFAQTWERWREWPNVEGGISFSTPTWVNKLRFPGGRQDPEIRRLYRSLGRARFLERCGGTPVEPHNLVFHGRWRPDKHVDHEVHYNPDLPIEIAVDPNYGQGHYYSVEFVQWKGEHTYVIDEVSETGLTHDEIIKLCATKPFWHRITGGVIDPWAGKSHIFGAASPEEVWWKEAKVQLRVSPRTDVESSIARMESLLRGPNGEVFIHFSPACNRARYEMAHWRRRKNNNQPSKDNCDAVKALCYWAAEHYAYQGFTSSYETKIEDWEMKPDSGTIDLEQAFLGVP